ncbi:MAG: hypothetical protein VYE73_06220 [Acidobacteriota bacterium]|nr:hypothetical protein [Acidobacteriota bacterium]
MSKWMIVSCFIGGAALSWGVYVPIVHEAAIRLGSNLRAFLFVGVAYFLVAVLIPVVIIFGLHADPTEKANQNFDSGPITWGIAAGIAGATGALCIIFAANTAGPGAALYVAPLVFAAAPIVNTIATMTIFHPVKTMPDWRFFLGLAMAAGGMAMVTLFKPPA